jgi:beta-glucanase (GH16 family)
MLRFALTLTTIGLTIGMSRSDQAPNNNSPSKAQPPKNEARLWIEAEDFTSLGGWILAQENSALMGRTSGDNGKNKNLTASTKITCETAGNYQLWVRSLDSKNAKIPRDFRIAINSIVSPTKLGTHGNEGWAWQNAGIFHLNKGEVVIELTDTSQYYARCDKMLLTTDMSYVPKGVAGDRNTDHIQPDNQQAPRFLRVNFNDLKSGALASQCSGEGFDANRQWSVQGDIQILTGDLQMPAANGREFIRSQRGKPFHISAKGEGMSVATRAIASPMKGQVWFSFLVKAHDASGKAGIKLLPSADPAQGYEILASGTDLSLKTSNTSETKTIQDTFPLGKTSLVIGRCDVDADRDGNRFLCLWVNPNIDELGTPLIKESLSDSVESITHLALVMAGGKSPATSPALDEAIVSNYPYPTGFYHVAPRKRHFGQWHIPVKAAEPATQLPPPGYKLVFSDEFDVNTLDHSKWNYRLRDKPDSAQEAENVEVRDGNLLIHARKQRVGKYNYTGGGIISKPLFVYGYYEARLKIPASEGWHTAFWTMPEYEPNDLRNTEIDFCEQDSGDPNYFSLGLINHREKGWNESNIGRWVVEDAPNMVEEFVTIAADFTPQSIRFYMNGRLTKEVDSRLFPHGPATVQLSCIASRKKGDRFQDDAHLPSQATFDYVRVYQHPDHAEAEAAAKAKALLPTLPLPPLSERQRTGADHGELD